MTVGESGTGWNFGAPGGSGTPSSSTSGDGAGVGYDLGLGLRPGERCSQSLYMFIAGADVFTCH